MSYLKKISRHFAIYASFSDIVRQPPPLVADIIRERPLSATIVFICLVLVLLPSHFKRLRGLPLCSICNNVMLKLHSLSRKRLYYTLFISIAVAFKDQDRVAPLVNISPVSQLITTLFV